MATSKRAAPVQRTDEVPARDHGESPDESRETTLDHTIEDTFPASDPPSSIPDPSEDTRVPPGPDDDP